jgi:acetylornithine aminotransferase
MLNNLKQKLDQVTGVIDIRGKGLMFGIELDRACPELVQKALDINLLINVTAGNVVRLLPPYIIDDEQADTIVDGVSRIIVDFLQKKTAA